PRARRALSSASAEGVLAPLEAGAPAPLPAGHRPLPAGGRPGHGVGAPGDPGGLALQLDPAVVAPLLQAPVLERRPDRAAGLGVVGAVAEAAPGHQLLDVGEGAGHPFTVLVQAGLPQ